MKDIKEIERKYQKEIKCFHEYNKTDKQIRKLEVKACQSHGLTITQFDVLGVLYRTGKLPIKELLNQTMSTSGNMTVVLKNMERDGWVMRTIDPDDKRSFIIEITTKGSDVIAGMMEEHLKNLSLAFGKLNDEEAQQFIQLLRKLQN